MCNFHRETRPSATVLARRLGWDVRVNDKSEIEVSIGGILLMREMDDRLVTDWMGATLAQRVAKGQPVKQSDYATVEFS